MAARLQEDEYANLYETYRWQVPADFNITELCCSRWASDPDRVAIFFDDLHGDRVVTYAQLQQDANRLSNVLQGLGVTRGTRVAIILPQRPEVAVAHLACHQLGAIAMPMSVLFGPDALHYRLQDSGAMIAIADPASLQNIRQIRPTCPQLKRVIAIDDYVAFGVKGG
jgi:acetyl-CoA synthetase